MLYRIPQAILVHERSFILEFTSEDIIVYSTHESSDNSITIRLYVTLPEEASKDTATTRVLPLATLQQVFVENGDIIKGYTLSSSLLAAISSPAQSKWKHFFGGGAAVVTFVFILTFLLCLGFAAYKWKQKKR